MRGQRRLDHRIIIKSSFGKKLIMWDQASEETMGTNGEQNALLHNFVTSANLAGFLFPVY